MADEPINRLCDLAIVLGRITDGGGIFCSSKDVEPTESRGLNFCLRLKPDDAASKTSGFGLTSSKRGVDVMGGVVLELDVDRDEIDVFEWLSSGGGRPPERDRERPDLWPMEREIDCSLRSVMDERRCRPVLPSDDRALRAWMKAAPKGESFILSTCKSPRETGFFWGRPFLSLEPRRRAFVMLRRGILERDPIDHEEELLLVSD